MILYHVSPERNTANIQAHGVDPTLSEGARQVSWWVAREKLTWAIAHVSARHDLSARHIDVHTANIKAFGQVSRFATRGVFTSKCVVRPDRVLPASAYLQGAE
jgi:hypothetical protein